MTTRWLALSLLTALVTAPLTARAGDAPVVLTTVRGDVALASGDALPEPPCVVQPGQVMTVGDGGLVVFLFQGAAIKVAGPAEIDPGELQIGNQEDSGRATALRSTFSRQASTARTAASRGAGDLQLLRPLAGQPVLALADIRWSCDGCGELEVSVENARDESVVFSGKGDGEADYVGGELPPGSYYLRIGDQDFSFLVPAAADRERIQGALDAAHQAADELVTSGMGDPAMAASIPGAVLLHEGLLSDALFLVDRAVEQHPHDEALAALLADYETRAGLRP